MERPKQVDLGKVNPGLLRAKVKNDPNRAAKTKGARMLAAHLLALELAAAFKPFSLGASLPPSVTLHRVLQRTHWCRCGWLVMDGSIEGDLKSLTVKDLKARLRCLGQPVSGNKAELIARLEQHSAGPTVVPGRVRAKVALQRAKLRALSQNTSRSGETAVLKDQTAVPTPNLAEVGGPESMGAGASVINENAAVHTAAVAHRERIAHAPATLNGKNAPTHVSPTSDDYWDDSEGLCLIDGHALAYRMHFALQQTALSTRDGEASHALHGFCYKLIDLHLRYPRHRILVAFDLPGATFRSEQLSTYKATRPPMPHMLRPQVDAMRHVCDCLGLPAVSVEGFEADDIIATCVEHARTSSAHSVVIVAADKDMMQLVTEPDARIDISMWNDKKKCKIDAAAVEAQFGVRPEQMGDLLALMGDASDNIPGVIGIGPKRAAKLLTEHGTLENVLAAASSMKASKFAQSLIDHADVARRARRLVELRTDVPVDATAARGAHPNFQSADLDAFLVRWELWRVRSKVAELRGSN